MRTDPLQLVVFAQTPPPHHGQSYMVQQLLAALDAPDSPVKCWHVNARLSQDLADVGSIRLGKIWKVLGCCGRALYLRFRHGATHLYYVPAPGKRGAIYRDWCVLALCRPFFRSTIFHWHAFGLGEWLETKARPWERRLTDRLHGGVELSIVLSEFNRADAVKLRPRRMAVVGNGIPDPCPDFAETVLPARMARRREERPIRQALFLAHCLREKGLFDALDGVALANARSDVPRWSLTVAGAFMDPETRREFDVRIGQPDLQLPGGLPAVNYVGFLEPAAKDRAFREADCFCFPTYYDGETFGLTLLEAAAYGLPAIVTRWRGLAEVAGPTAFLVDPKQPEQIAEALRAAASSSGFAEARAHFVDKFRVDVFARAMRENLATA